MLTLESNKPRVALICVGSELLRGKVNTHGSTLARSLASIGLELGEERTLADDPTVLAQAIRQTLVRFDVILITGGLGPTFDDVTREAAAAASGHALKLSKPLLRLISSKFRKAGYRHMPPANTRQAYLLAGARPIKNSRGTAPGQILELPGPRLLILLPGPPVELYPMIDSAVLPALRRVFPAGPRSEAHLHFVGVPESVVDHKIRPVISAAQKRSDIDLQFTILAHLGLVDFDIFVSASSLAKAQRSMGRIVTQIRRRLGSAFYGQDVQYPLEKVVGDLLRRRRATLAVAESCTGGMLSSRLTDIPGSSDYFLGGIVSYSNTVKERQLGVARGLLRDYGAVSRPVARAMAEGIRQRLGATWGLSITGIAGPSGGSRRKPVGLVYIGLASATQTRVHEYTFRGTRDAIRQRSVVAALDLLRSL